MRWAFQLCAALLLLGCTSVQDDLDEGVPVSPSVQDDPSQALIRLSYVNTTGGMICIGPESWPSSGGIVDSGGDRYYLVVNETRYFLGRESDYCPRCGTEVRAGERISGVLHYASFSLPAELYNAPKVLVFKSTAWRCPQGLDGP